MALCSPPVVMMLDENSCEWPVGDGMGLNQETTSGVHRFREIAAKDDLPLLAINEKNCVTVTNFDIASSCHHSPFHSIIHTLEVDGNRILVHLLHCHDNVGRGFAFDLRDVNNYVLVIDIDLIIVPQACLEEFQMSANIGHFDNEIDINDLEPFPWHDS
mmetsp:Transcript_14145/g.22509  ORF Transcript_14145/g.22509 Transcript_14145/m.22509 type:complete len:159 (+) Transcript_14145:113-589(+)|eukprot:CAMPEP_0115049490 /NCGR_PEP_ID=MMETSP0227-20121206/1222_1 /TAXON_ID=89957 /ORGANISM="Polarella glacialis, Strain CCMP 1383" /LENGTH=158 /DNA_ID=CAMNT_0002433169 /DNA_START=50 /DNA_END=526 /DNA_ORIENTATION=-